MATAANNAENEITNATPKSVVHISAPVAAPLPPGRGS